MRVDADADADVYFPKFNKADFNIVKIENRTDDNLKYKFVEYVREKI